MTDVANQPGYRVRFQVVKYDPPLLLERKRKGKGGQIKYAKVKMETKAVVTKRGDDGKEVYVAIGSSFCSILDNFDGKKGRRESLKKAIAPLPREERKKIWAKVLPTRHRVIAPLPTGMID